jgi:hypothetical protein
MSGQEEGTVTGSTRATMAVAKYSAASGGGVQAHFLDDGDEVRVATISGLDSPLVTGTHQVGFSERGISRPLQLTITPRGKVFDLKAGDGTRTALGMGIADPEFPDALLVSWWCGEIRPAGIVKYMLGSEPDTIIPTYTSVMLEASGVHDVRGGRATGSTASGFPGRYTITYEGAGSTTFGPFDWTIASRAGVLDLTWEAGGRRVIDGFGFPDPHSSRSIIVVYWGARKG